MQGCMFYQASEQSTLDFLSDRMLIGQEKSFVRRHFVNRLNTLFLQISSLKVQKLSLISSTLSHGHLIFLQG